VSEGRRLAAIVLLFLIGFGLIGLASQVDSTWPLFVTVVPYSLSPWLVVHGDAGRAGDGPPRPEAPEPA
jgi:hypothetical protein